MARRDIVIRFRVKLTCMGKIKYQMEHSSLSRGSELSMFRSGEVLLEAPMWMSEAFVSVAQAIWIMHDKGQNAS